MKFGCGRHWACVEFGETSPYRLVGYWNHGRRVQLGPLVLEFGSPWTKVDPFTGEAGIARAWGVIVFQKMFLRFAR